MRRFLCDVKKVCAALFAVLCFGCMALTEKAGQALEGTAFEEKTLERYATAGKELTLRKVQYRKNGEGWVLELKAWPTLKFHFMEITGGTSGEADNSGGTNNANGAFVPVYCSFLGSALSGWNEFTMDLAGGGTITGTGEAALTTALNSIELIDIGGGRIRRGDVKLSGSEALTALRNRKERIEALTEWMHGYIENTGEQKVFPGQKEFENYWKPILLPEQCPAKKRPALYQSEGAQWARAEDVRWNTSYTALIFPEDLHILRDSGSLLRDWEEAASWIYLVYEWDAIIQTVTRENYFFQTKK